MNCSIRTHPSVLINKSTTTVSQYLIQTVNLIPSMDGACPNIFSLKNLSSQICHLHAHAHTTGKRFIYGSHKHKNTRENVYLWFWGPRMAWISQFGNAICSRVSLALSIWKCFRGPTIRSRVLQIKGLSEGMSPILGGGLPLPECIRMLQNPHVIQH